MPGRFARQRNEGEEQRATTLELFYDLVFVFAITQISHTLINHLTWEGVGQAAMVLLVIWWAWSYTTWVTNELDPDSFVVRLVIIGVMLATLLMAAAIPHAFGKGAILFAGSYVLIQVGRHLFVTFVSARRGTIERERSGRILMWLSAAGAFWLAGAFAEGDARIALWVAALVIDYSGPILLYRVPGLRRLSADVWYVHGTHFAERFQLFMIIALGESIVITGATTTEFDFSIDRLAAFAVAFLGTAALWWLYFNYVAAISLRRLELSLESTKLARDAYTYLHVVMVAGVIVCAVGDEFVISHPTSQLSSAQAWVVVAGPAIYLLGHVLFRLRMTSTWSVRRLAGAGACVAIGLFGTRLPALLLLGMILTVLIAVIVSEHRISMKRRARGELSPLEQLEASAGEG